MKAPSDVAEVVVVAAEGPTSKQLARLREGCDLK